jgi:ubiquitin-like protein Pup
MGQQQQEAKKGTTRQEGEVTQEFPVKKAGEVAVKASDTATEDTTNADQELDKLLAEIDRVLEENPEEFVNSYVQKGGQ